METESAQRFIQDKINKQTKTASGLSTQAAAPAAFTTPAIQNTAHPTAAIGHPSSHSASFILTSGSTATAAAAAAADKGESTALHLAFKPAAHIYSLLHAPWIRHVSLGRPRPQINPNSLERFQTAQSRADGIVAEVLDLVPCRLHNKLVEDSAIQSMVSARLSNVPISNGV